MYKASKLITTIGVRDGGSGGAVDPPIRADIWHLFGQKTTHFRAKDNTFVWLTVSPRTEQVSIYLRYISGGLTKETFIGYSLRPSKTGTAIVHCYFFSLAGPRDKQVFLPFGQNSVWPPKWMFARTPMITTTGMYTLYFFCFTHTYLTVMKSGVIHIHQMWNACSPYKRKPLG